jgi:hypothetical protein
VRCEGGLVAMWRIAIEGRRFAARWCVWVWIMSIVVG